MKSVSPDNQNIIWGVKRTVGTELMELGGMLLTCKNSRGVSAVVLPNKVAHVSCGVAGGEQAPHIDGIKL